MQIKTVLQIKGGLKMKKHFFVLLMITITLVSFSFLLLADNNDDWLHARGNQIYDKYGNEVWLTGPTGLVLTVVRMYSTVPGMISRPY